MSAYVDRLLSDHAGGRTLPWVRTSLLASPQQGADAAGTVPAPVPACTPHRLLGQVAHYHLTGEERRACEAEHAALMARLDEAAWLAGREV